MTCVIPQMSMMKPLDVIHQAGPGGQFMNTDHTLEHWRQLWTLRLFDRQWIEMILNERAA